MSTDSPGNMGSTASAWRRLADLDLQPDQLRTVMFIMADMQESLEADRDSAPVPLRTDGPELQDILAHHVPPPTDQLATAIIQASRESIAADQARHNELMGVVNTVVLWMAQTNQPINVPPN